MSTVRRNVVSEPVDRTIVTEPVERTVVAAPVQTVTARRYDHATERRWAFDACDVVALLAGLLYGVMGLLVLIKIGVADFPNEATTEVLGLTQTQIWGGVGLFLGLLLLGSVGGYGRALTTFGGALLVVTGIVVVSAFEQLDATLATEKGYGWLAIAVGVVVLLAAIATPTVAARETRVVDDTVV